jgi:hypothetical protein
MTVSFTHASGQLSSTFIISMAISEATILNHLADSLLPLVSFNLRSSFRANGEDTELHELLLS